MTDIIELFTHFSLSFAEIRLSMTEVSRKSSDSAEMFASGDFNVI